MDQDETKCCTSSLCEQRPRDINLRIAVCGRDGEGNLNLFSNTGLSTLDPVLAKEHVNNNFACVSTSVTTATLSSLFQIFLPKQQEIHFLKIDTEGLEAEVLTSNAWSPYRPWIVVIESTLPMSQVECHHTWKRLVFVQIVHMQTCVFFKRLLNRMRALVERKPAVRKLFLKCLRAWVLRNENID